MASMGNYRCDCCKQMFRARVADRNRGWARYCSKSCKAVKQDQRGGRYQAYRESYEDDWHLAGLDAMEAGWDGHKVWI
jgi:hypothetical protein